METGNNPISIRLVYVREMNVSELKDEERQPCEVWTRVMGYHRPVTSFNLGKKQEHRDRTTFKEHRVKYN